MFILCGAVVAVSWIVALAAAIPPRAAVAYERIGVAELEAHDLTRAETEFAGVLELAPRSADARLGLACALWAQKRASGAAIESVIAIEDGLVYPDDASCGSLGSFAGLFSRDDSGPAVVLLVPRAAPAGMTMARAIGMIGRGSVANGTNQLETIHVMAAACLAWEMDSTACRCNTQMLQQATTELGVPHWQGSFNVSEMRTRARFFAPRSRLTLVNASSETRSPRQSTLTTCLVTYEQIASARRGRA